MDDKNLVVCQISFQFPPITGVDMIQGADGVGFRLRVHRKIDDRTSQDAFVPVTEQQLDVLMRLVEFSRKQFAPQT